jgi:predicted DNA-binding ribbon-helix-helix protein
MTACVDRVQTGVRMEKRLVKVLKAVAEFYSVSLGELLEEIVASTFAGRRPFSEAAMARAADLARIYGLDLESLSSAHVEERG